MCGRFYVDKDKLVSWILEKLNKGFDQQQLDFLATGEIKPTDCSIVFSNKNYTIMKWGYEIFDHININTRVESILEKDYYDSDYKNNKCVILANGFYEWDEDDVKHYFHGDGEYLFIAGIYQDGEPFNRYSILTKEATSTRKVHNRVPVLVPRDKVADFIQGKLEIADLKRLEVKLTDEPLFESLTLF